MATTRIEAVSQLHTVPLVSIHHPVFAHHYEEGLAYALHKGHETTDSLDDLYLVDSFLLARHNGHFDGSHEQDLSRQIGFALGAIHGGVLCSDGTLRPDVSTLARLHDPDLTRGYHAGREFFFTEADTEAEWHMTDISLIDLLRELAEEYTSYEDALRTVRFNIGCKLGELSGHLFPWIDEEQQTMEAESIRELGYVCAINPKSIAARQFAVLQAVS